MDNTHTPVADFRYGYVEALIWQDMDDEVSAMHGECFDAFDDASALAIMKECDDFSTGENFDLIAQAIELDTGYTWAQAGHDFALTRNGHGAGFWDRGLGVIGEKLSDAARVYGDTEVWLDEETGHLRTV
jgi:hypothetical protein